MGMPEDDDCDAVNTLFDFKNGGDVSIDGTIKLAMEDACYSVGYKNGESTCKSVVADGVPYCQKATETKMACMAYGRGGFDGSDSGCSAAGCEWCEDAYYTAGMVATTRTAVQRAPPLRPQPPLQSPPRVQAPRLGPPRPCPAPPPPSLRRPPPPKAPPLKRKPAPLPRPPPPWPWTQSPCRGTTQCARKVQLLRQTSKRRQSPTA